jgi:hypothetical protein
VGGVLPLPRSVGARIVLNPQRVAGQARLEKPMRSCLAQPLRVETTRASGKNI